MWLFTKNFDEFKVRYSFLMGKEYEVYDVVSERIYNAKVIGFKEEKHYNSIVCQDINNNRRELYINENYININKQLWWLRAKGHKDSYHEFVEYFKDVYNKEFDCIYKSQYYRCIVVSLENTQYSPKFKCKIIGGKTVSLHDYDINFENLTIRRWENKRNKDIDLENRIKNFVSGFKSLVGQTLEVYDNATKNIYTGEVISANKNETITVKITDEHIIEVAPDCINYSGSELYLHKKYTVDPKSVYQNKYTKYLNKTIHCYIDYKIIEAEYIDIITIKKNNMYDIYVKLLYNNEYIQLPLKDVNFNNSKSWLNKFEKEISEHNKITAQELRKEEIARQKKIQEEEKRAIYNKKQQEKLNNIQRYTNNDWKDAIGNTYDCIIKGEIKNCKILYISSQDPKISNPKFRCEVDNEEVSLKRSKINIFNEEDWKEEAIKTYNESKSSKELSYEEEMEKMYEIYEKNAELVWDLDSMRDCMCGVGTRKVKMMLNKKIKSNDEIADLYRTALEIEDCNISAKKYRGSYKHDYYDKKQELILELLDKCEQYNFDNPDNQMLYGVQEDDGYSTNAIVYFELPGCEQISFHTTLSNYEIMYIPNYEKPWDGKVNSTMYKLEDAINNRYYKDKIDE